MRLTCPNCSARYEVDEAMVPAGGRDVQCSNCSTTWFQPGPRIAEPITPVADRVREEAPEPVVQPRLTEVDIDPPSAGAGTSKDPAARPDRPTRRQIDPNVADILRAEAERERRLRQTVDTPETVENQEEMLLDATDDSPRARRIAELEGAEDAFVSDEVAASVAAGASASRREVFPDIEEINSTLRATGDRREEEANATDVDTVGSTGRRRSSARLGFFGVLLLAAIFVGVYAYAPQIAEAVPALDDALEAYVSLVNQGRLWLDETARSLAGETTSQ